MEDCETNDCRKEKRGCKGCYYDKSEGNMSYKNIDKDIEILKKLKTEKDIETGYKTYLLDTEQQQAIENVLSELETYKKMVKKMCKDLIFMGTNDELTVEELEKAYREYIEKEVEKDE